MFSGVGALCLAGAARERAAVQAVLFIAAAACLQLRLLCNLLDGLMAVEGGLKTKTGEIFNEFPDRIADVLLLIAAGYATRFEQRGAIELGYLCAVAALLTAYVRAFGGAVELPQDFCGPMAKQQRMATLTVACGLAAGESLLQWPHRVIFWSLGLIFVGSLVTAARRTVRIARLMNARS